MRTAIDRAVPCPTTVEAWLMKYVGRSEEQIAEMSGSFDAHCAARTVRAMEKAGAVFPDPTDMAFRTFKDAIIKHEEKPDGIAIDNHATASEPAQRSEPQERASKL